MTEEFSWIELMSVLVLFLVWGIALLIFNRTTVPRIDKRIEEAGCSREMPVDIMGTRALSFSDVLALGFLGINSSKYPFINGELVNKYATSYDKGLGFIVSISQYVMFLVVFIGWLIRSVIF